MRRRVAPAPDELGERGASSLDITVAGPHGAAGRATSIELGVATAVRLEPLEPAAGRGCINEIAGEAPWAYDLPTPTPPSMVEHIGGCERTA